MQESMLIVAERQDSCKLTTDENEGKFRVLVCCSELGHSDQRDTAASHAGVLLYSSQYVPCIPFLTPYTPIIRPLHQFYILLIIQHRAPNSSQVHGIVSLLRPTLQMTL
jgi:hypothetical protein